MPASTFNNGGTTVIIPIIGRFPGAGGSQWRTDVFISAHSSVGNTPALTFYLAGGSPMTITVTLVPYSSVALRDIVLNTFGQTNAAGQLEIKHIFARFGITPQADVMVEFNGDAPVYGYASEVRNDTGDAIFIFGTSPNG